MSAFLIPDISAYQRVCFITMRMVLRSTFSFSLMEAVMLEVCVKVSLLAAEEV